MTGSNSTIARAEENGSGCFIFLDKKIVVIRKSLGLDSKKHWYLIIQGGGERIALFLREVLAGLFPSALDLRLVKAYFLNAFSLLSPELREDSIVFELKAVLT